MLNKNRIIKTFCDHPSLKFLEGKFEDLKRTHKLPPKRESLILYREALKMCRKFFWRSKDGKEWSEILQKSARMEFENNKNLLDSAEVGKLLVVGKQSLIELEEKILNVHNEMNKHFQNSRNDGSKP